MEDTNRQKLYITLCLLGIFLMFFGLWTGYLLGTKHEKNVARVKEKRLVKRNTIPLQISVSPTIPITSPIRITRPTTSSVPPIPADWKYYTATDPEFGVRVTMALPPGYSFSFTGSEFTILNNQTLEYWDYRTSIFNGRDGIKNYYDGGSRRIWFQKYITDNTFGNFAQMDTKIISVDDSNPTYLKIMASTPGYADQTYYITVKNGILSIFQFVNAKDSLDIATVISSLSVSQTK